MIDALLTLGETLALLPRARRPILLGLHQVSSADWLRSFGEGLARGWTPIPLAEFVSRHASRTLRREHVAVTFDDGFRSIRTIAEPVLGGLGIPFTTFVCGEVLGGGPAPWFYRVEQLLRLHPATRLAEFWNLRAESVPSGLVLLNALKSGPFRRVMDGLERAEQTLSVPADALRDDFLSPADLVALAASPLVTIGSHTLRHPILTSLSAEEQDREIAGGSEAVAAVIGRPPRLFAYPNGKPADFGAVTFAALRRHGFEGAVTTVQRPVARGDDPLQLPRLGVSEGDGIRKIRLKRALPWPGRGDRLEAKIRSQFASAWKTPG